MPRAGSEPPDSPELLARIAATLRAHGYKRVEVGPKGERAGYAFWEVDYAASALGDRARESAWERGGRRSYPNYQTRTVRVSEIADKAVRARIEAADKAGAANGSHVPLGPILGKEVDAAFREMVAEALARDAAVRACEALYEAARRAVAAGAWGRYGVVAGEERSDGRDGDGDDDGRAEGAYHRTEHQRQQELSDGELLVEYLSVKHGGRRAWCDWLS